jgi:hypothetical protein
MFALNCLILNFFGTKRALFHFASSFSTVREILVPLFYHHSHLNTELTGKSSFRGPFEDEIKNRDKKKGPKSMGL